MPLRFRQGQATADMIPFGPTLTARRTSMKTDFSVGTVSTDASTITESTDVYQRYRTRKNMTTTKRKDFSGSRVVKKGRESGLVAQQLREALHELQSRGESLCRMRRELNIARKSVLEIRADMEELESDMCCVRLENQRMDTECGAIKKQMSVLATKNSKLRREIHFLEVQLMLKERLTGNADVEPYGGKVEDRESVYSVRFTNSVEGITESMKARCA